MLDERVASGAYRDIAIDTVSLRLPWPLPHRAVNDGFTLAYDVAGEIQWESERRLSIKNYGPSWAASVSCRTCEGWLELSGSPVKFLTGQNLHQPTEDLIWLLRRFLPRLQAILEQHLDASLGMDWVENCLAEGLVTRIDLNRQFFHGSDRRARDWLTTALGARHGLKLGGRLYPYKAFSDTSVRSGPKRRWHLAVYLKRPEMGVTKHLPRVDLKDALLNEAEGVSRHELRTTSEGLSHEQRRVLHWSRRNIERHFASYWEHLYEPGVEIIERERTQRRIRRSRLGARVDYEEAVERAKVWFSEQYGIAPMPESADMAVIFSRAREIIERKSSAKYVDRYEWIEDGERKVDELRGVEADVLSQYQAGIHVYEKLLASKAERTIRRIVTNIRECAGVDITVAPVVAGRVVPLRQVRPTIWTATRSFESLCA